MLPFALFALGLDGSLPRFLVVMLGMVLAGGVVGAGALLALRRLEVPWVSAPPAKDGP